MVKKLFVISLTTYLTTFQSPHIVYVYNIKQCPFSRFIFRRTPKCCVCVAHFILFKNKMTNINLIVSFCGHQCGMK